MQLTDWIGVALVVCIVGFVGYKIIGKKPSSKGCGCGGSGKCSKPKVYSSEDKESYKP